MLTFAKKGAFFVGHKFSQLFHKIKPSTEERIEADINEQLVMGLNQKKVPSVNQLKQLPKFLNKKEKIQLLIAVLVLITSVGTLTWRFYIKNSIAVPNYGGSYTEGLVGSPRLINPILASNDVDRDLVKLIFSGLMKYDEQGNLVPDLAKGYNLDAEQTVYTFELRDNLHWHDGEPLTVDDIIFTINSIKNNEYKSPFKNSFSGVTMRRVNEKTIEFELEKPFAPFLSILTIGIIPEHMWYSVPAFGASLAELNIKPVGSGPYMFKSLTRDNNGVIRSYTLEAYKDYHLDRSFISELNFKFYLDYESAVAALQNKNVDGLVYLPPSYKEDIKNKFALHELQFPQYTAIFFNPKNNELLAENDFRKALAISVDRERILTEVLNGSGQIINSPILPGLLGYDESIQGPEFNTEEAKKILDDMGWTMPEDGQYRIKKPEEEPDEGEEVVLPELSMKLTTIDQAENVKAVSIIKENWESIGIKTELEIVSKDRIKQDVIDTRNYQALVFGQVINTNSGSYPFWHSTQNESPGLNLSVLANRDVDKFLELARDETSQDLKIQALKDFQNKLLELNFAVFLYNPTYIYPTTNSLKGLDDLRFINLPADRFNNINFWYIKTKRVLSTDKQN